MNRRDMMLVATPALLASTIAIPATHFQILQRLDTHSKNPDTLASGHASQNSMQQSAESQVYKVEDTITVPRNEVAVFRLTKEIQDGEVMDIWRQVKWNEITAGDTILAVGKTVEIWKAATPPAKYTNTEYVEIVPGSAKVLS